MKIQVYEDNDDYREGLTMLIKYSGEHSVAGVFINCDEVEKNYKEHQPDLILMDIEMPGTNGLKGLERLRKIAPAVPVLMLTVFEDDENLFNALCIGATGYLLKKTTPDELYKAISEASSGGAPMSTVIARKVVSFFNRNASEKENALTPKEKEVLKLLVEGNSYKMIADELDISFETVKSHIKKIYEKLHVNSQSQAVAKAIRERLV